MKYLSSKFALLSILLVVAFNATIFAYTIGADENGIICFTDGIEPINNEWLSFDLNFDGLYEKYYFNKDGYLEMSKYIGNDFVNEYGQKLENSTLISYVEPKNTETYMIDNVNYYYINKVKSKYTKNWQLTNNKKTRITIQIPEITGINDSITKTVNDIINTRGIELLKLYAREVAYKTDARKLYISIDACDKKKPHTLNFIPNYNGEFYFNFTTVSTNDKNKTTTKYVGICVDPVNNACSIKNTEYEKLNYLSFSEDEDINSVIGNDNINGSANNKSDSKNTNNIDTVNGNDNTNINNNTNTNTNNNSKTNTNNYTYNSRYKNLINDIKTEYIEKLRDYIDNADTYVYNYGEKNDNQSALLRAVENYIKDIETIFNTYDKKARKYKNEGNLDTESYNTLKTEMNEILEKYKTVLSNKLAGDINTVKENINREQD